MTPIEFIFICVVCVLALTFSGEGSAVSDANQPDWSEVDDCGRLEKMWDQQLEFMKLLQRKRNFPQFPTDITSKKGQQFLKDIRNHMMEELFEAGQHLKNAKSHRATELPEIDREAYKEELVDALHLYFELVIASGISLDELVEAYLDKGKINQTRIETGY